MPGTVHEMSVAKIKSRRPDEALRTGGINAFLRKVAGELDIDLYSDVDRFERRPDAWSYVAGEPGEPGTFNLYEIEDSNKLSPEKLYDYAWTWFYLDDYGFEVNLFVYDRYGEKGVQLCLCEYWFMFLQEDIAREDEEKREAEAEAEAAAEERSIKSPPPQTKAEKDAYFASLVANRKSKLGW